MDLDKFGEIIYNFLKDNNISMLIEVPEGALDPVIKDNTGMGPVIKFYILLIALKATGKQLRSDMGITSQEAWEGAIDGILKLVKNDLMEE
ncbi:MAG: hypothetical protein SO181_10565 [Frisingicoccus sp.]|uniref:hypothetical protein n=1 Tax=Frisingicoccus sp. TaxID=1918627 RepID=UPI002A818F9D|nr:hypothetical protein [Frisingicoccus sp.]MDY4835565.1 hypothetical protein [Frisingicoccus sp.]